MLTRPSFKAIRAFAFLFDPPFFFGPTELFYQGFAGQRVWRRLPLDRRRRCFHRNGVLKGLDGLLGKKEPKFAQSVGRKQIANRARPIDEFQFDESSPSPAPQSPMRHEFKRPSRRAPYLIRPLIWEDFTEKRANEQCNGIGFNKGMANQQSPVYCTHSGHSLPGGTQTHCGAIFQQSDRGT